MILLFHSIDGMEQHTQRYSLSDKESAIIDHFTTTLNKSILVQQEILAQLTLLNNRVSTLEHIYRNSLNTARFAQT